MKVYKLRRSIFSGDITPNSIHGVLGYPSFFKYLTFNVTKYSPDKSIADCTVIVNQETLDKIRTLHPNIKGLNTEGVLKIRTSDLSPARP